MKRTHHTLSLRCPRFLLWPHGEVVVRNGIYSCIKREGWRMAVWMTRLSITVRREALGDPFRHGFCLFLSTPWAGLNLNVRYTDITTGELVTSLRFAWGHYPNWKVTTGMIPFRHEWSKKFWGASEMCSYRDSTGALRIIPTEKLLG